MSKIKRDISERRLSKKIVNADKRVDYRRKEDRDNKVSYYIVLSLSILALIIMGCVSAVFS